MAKVDFAKLISDARDSDAYLLEKASMSFLTNLWRLMKQEKVTQKQLAEKTGLKESYISRIFARKGNLTLATMVKLAKCFEADVMINVEPRQAAAQMFDYFCGEKEITQEARVVFTNIHHVDTSRWQTSGGSNDERIDLTA